MKKIIKKILAQAGYSLVKSGNTTVPTEALPLDMFEPEFKELYAFCKPFSMTSPERMYALFVATDYVLKNNIAGDFVECGVWRGGSSMLIAKMLTKRNITNRKIFLYDTFEGMAKPTAEDVDFRGQSASQVFEQNLRHDGISDWCLADIDDVRNNMRKTSFPSEQTIYVKGKVEDTIPQTIPENKIAVLRLDTDWYTSTKHELMHLFPKLEKKGVLIIDDYGHWEGCRKAVDEYFSEENTPILLNRIDYTARIGIKS